MVSCPKCFDLIGTNAYFIIVPISVMRGNGPIEVVLLL